MTTIISCRCDNCDTDLYRSYNSIDYRITIKSERIPSRSGAVTDMNILPQIETPMHFCGIACMRKYLEAKWKEMERNG